MFATAKGPRLLAPILVLFGVVAACGSKGSEDIPSFPVAGRSGDGEAGLGAGGASVGGTGATGAVAGTILSFGGTRSCVRKTCKELGVGCGRIVDDCGGEPIDCADEGLTCGPLEICIGGPDQPAKCETSFGPCEVCNAIPDCKEQGTTTRLTGRVVTPGRNDADTANQVGVPNAVVYIMRNTDIAEVPPISSGIPAGGTSCDRCEDQMLGPTLIGTVTDATGRFELEGSIPVGVEFLLVVKVGKFRRAVKHTLPESAACETTELATTLPDNPTRLPRTMTDGLAVNIPTIAVSTGQIDAMECVLEKIGLDHALFGNPAPITPESARIHLFRSVGVSTMGGGPRPPGGGGGAGGGPPALSGAKIDAMTPGDPELYGSLETLEKYDFVISDCEGLRYDASGAERQASGANLREYVNRGGRLFSSHLSYTWLSGNGMAAFDPASPHETGLAAAATWTTQIDTTNSAVGSVAIGRPNASPRIENFAEWLAAEGVISPPMNTFDIVQPRSSATAIGPSSEEFVYSLSSGMGGQQRQRTQQFSFNTPYGAPESEVCGRVAYSGFHVAAVAGSDDPYLDATFPEHCMGSLTPQEKVLLYMIFDLGACIGELPPPPKCEPQTCDSTMTLCGYIPDGCGNVVDCGPCPPPK